MGKSEPSDESLQKWIKEGWKFRVKISKGRKYITRRMGAKTERSLGPFNQELWNRIKSIQSEAKKPPREKDPLYMFYSLMEYHRGAQAGRDCQNKDDEGYCTYWRWESDYGFLNFREDLKVKVVKDGGKIFFLFFANPRYCQGCNAYVSSEIKQVLTS